MFRPHGYFRSVPCPNISDCPLPNCFFSHDPSTRQPSSSSDNAEASDSKVNVQKSRGGPSSSVDSNSRPDDDAEQPSKRRKLEFQPVSIDNIQSESRRLKREPPTATGNVSTMTVPAPATKNVDGDGVGGGGGDGDWTVVGRDTKRTKSKKEDAGPVVPRAPLKSILKKSQPPSSTTPVPPVQSGATTAAAAATSSKGSTATGSSLKSLTADITKPALPPSWTPSTMAKKKQLPLSKPSYNKFAALASADDGGAGTSTPAPVKKESLIPRMIAHPPATHILRQGLLDVLFAELSRLNPELAKISEGRQQIVKAAVEEEEQTAKENFKTYGMVMKNRVMALKKTTVEKYQSDETQSLTKKLAAAAKAGENKEAGGGGEGVVIDTGLTTEAEVVALRHYTHKKEELAAYNYIMAAPSEDDITEARKALQAAAGYEECDRCKSRFRVYPGRREEDGSLASGGQCTYHWGKAFQQRKTPGSTADTAKIWECCNQSLGETAGCSTADNHVFVVKSRNRLATVWQFIETPGADKPGNHDAPSAKDDEVKSTEEDDNTEENDKLKAICLDCEMCYTIHGLELCRVTATEFPDHEHVLDVLVRPFGEVLDLNTRFSGVTKAQYASAKPYVSRNTENVKSTNKGSNDQKNRETQSNLQIVSDPSKARDVLLSLISRNTVIVGHALDNDLNSLRIIHPTIVDTAILFPHRRGLPLRNSLKWLVRTHLKRDIQTQGLEGHDSREDADSAGDLVRWRIAQDVKMKNIGEDGTWKKNKRK